MGIAVVCLASSGETPVSTVVVELLFYLHVVTVNLEYGFAIIIEPVFFCVFFSS